MCLYTQEYWRKSLSKIAKNDKKRNFHIFCWPPIFTKKRFLKFFDKNWCKPTQRTEKKLENGYLRQSYDRPKLSKLKKPPQMSSSKMNIFELFKNENWRSNICPPTGFSQLLSLGFEYFVYIHWENRCSKNQPNRRWSLITWSILIKNRS
jgi:hypothetical protein